jgi:hypothetical protein
MAAPDPEARSSQDILRLSMIVKILASKHPQAFSMSIALFTGPRAGHLLP